MALIDCPECGHQVSDQADACPSCGRRLTDQITQLEGELARIDLEWRRVRKNLILRSGWGWERVPTRSFALLYGALLVIPGLALTGLFLAFAISGEPLNFFLVMVGPCMLAIGLGCGVYLYRKAPAYEKANAAYRQWREAARKKYGG